MKTILKTISLVLLCSLSVVMNAYSQNMEDVSASDPNIQYMGRIDDSNPNSVLFAYPGVSIRAKFVGTQIDAVLVELGNGSITGTNYFNVIIDGGVPSVLKLSRSQTVYTLASNLSPGIHTVELFKRTESSVGSVRFEGFRVETGSGLLAPEQLPAKKIMFIGNSITCGYGNEIATANPELYRFTAANENNYKAWGAVTARNINAQYHCIAHSGRGLFQNNSGSITGVALTFFNQTIADNTSMKWDHTRYIPDVVVINLGTNDFAAEANSSSFTVSDSVFTNAYVRFIASVRAVYPHANIVCVVGVMMSDFYPSGKKQWTRIQNYTRNAVASASTNGDDAVFFLALEPQQGLYGEDWHPTAETDSVMAAKTTAFISKLPNPGNCKSSISLGRDISIRETQFPLILNSHITTGENTMFAWYKDGKLLYGKQNPTLELANAQDATGVYTVSVDSGFCRYSGEISIVDDLLHVGELANWEGNKEASLVLTFDDWSAGHPAIVVPELKKRQLHGTFSIYPSNVKSWTKINEAFLDGNEIANHSNTHIDISKVNLLLFHTEVSDPQKLLEQKIEGLRIATFVYPYGAFNSALIDTLQALRYVGARGVWPSAGNYTYAFARKPADYYNILTYSMSNSVTIDSFTAQLNKIVKGGGLLTFLYHSVNSPTVTDNNYSAVSQAHFAEQLDSIKAYSDRIWVTTFENSLKYHREKACASLVEIQAPSAERWVLHLTDTLSDNETYNYPLTILLPLEGRYYDMICQNGKMIPIDSIYNDTIQFRAVPDGGYIILSSSGIKSDFKASSYELYNSYEQSITFSVNITAKLNSITDVALDLSALGADAKHVMTTKDGALYFFDYVLAKAFPLGTYKVTAIVTDSERNKYADKVFISILDGISIVNYSIEPALMSTQTDSLFFRYEITDDTDIKSVILDLSALGVNKLQDLHQSKNGIYTLTLKLPIQTVGNKTVALTITDATGNVKRTLYSLSVNKSVVSFINISETLILYPNPCSDFVNIPAEISSDLQIHLYDHSGMIVFSGYGALSYDLTGLPSGLYLVELSSDKYYNLVKFVKE